MRVIIRADGNREIAMGHVMRCLSVADALRDAGAEVIFVTAGKETEALIQGKGYRNHILGTCFRDMDGELPAFYRFFQENPAELILVDSYFVTGQYMKAIAGWTRTAYMDDLGAPVYPADALINYNIYAGTLPYREWYRRENIPFPGMCLLGCGYAPLREEFRKGMRSRTGESAADVLITTGGGDRADAAGKLCRRLALEKRQGLHPGIRYHVVCGRFAEHKEELRKLSAEYPEFIIHENVTKMSELMKECDVAVSAAGSTMYELCSMRLPAVCFYFAENQRQMAECFDRTTEIRNAGNIMEHGEAVIDALVKRLTELELDKELRGRIRRQMETLTDGNGAARIAEKLLQLLETQPKQGLLLRESS